MGLDALPLRPGRARCPMCQDDVPWCLGGGSGCATGRDADPWRPSGGRRAAERDAVPRRPGAGAMVAMTSTITTEVDTIKRHCIFTEEGRTISPPVPGAPLDFKRANMVQSRCIRRQGKVVSLRGLFHMRGYQHFQSSARRTATFEMQQHFLWYMVLTHHFTALSCRYTT